MPVLEVKPGTRLRSAVSEAEVVVVRAAGRPVDLRCGGEPLQGVDGAGGHGAVTSEGDPLVLGKRYVDEELGLELLCTKGGAGGLAVDGRPLVLKGAKTLPSSD